MIYGIDYSYVVALGIFFVGWTVLWTAKKFLVGNLLRLAGKTNNDFDDALVSVLQTISPLVLGIAALAFAVRFTSVPAVAMQAISAVFLIAVVYQVSVGAARVVDVAVQKRQGKRVLAGQKAAITLLSTTIKWIIWMVGGLLVLSNLGINITSLVSGLGICGVAFALSLHNILF